MTTQHPDILEIVRNDPRYAYEAYEFVFESLGHTQRMLGRVPVENERESGPQHHVSGQEILKGACDLAVKEFGLMAGLVFRHWGIHRTDDFGELVFNLIEGGLLSKTDGDNRSDFENVFDLDRELSEGFTFPLEEVVWSKRGIR